MSLVTVTRSPTPNNVPKSPFTFPRTARFSLGDAEENPIRHNYVALKGAALILPISECVHRRIDSNETTIHHHLQMICDLLCMDHCLKIAVHLESANDNHTRYMALVSPEGDKDLGPAAVILGIDIVPYLDGRDTKATIGLILPLFCDMDVRLCEDGYFVVSSNNEQNFFKPVSVQVLWSALQSLYLCQESANNPKHLNKAERIIKLPLDWTSRYQVNSVYANISEWNKSCEDVEIRFTSPIYDLHKSELELDLQMKIEQALREIMTTVDLEAVTTVTLREKLEQKLSMNLHSRRSWIDEKILVVLEQFNSPSSIRDYLLLGSEGNASDLNELKRQNVTHILNITREVDNFFPNHGFIYKNIRIDDDEEARLLNDWDTTNMFILEAKKQKSRVLVHCKMGVSRSAATVIAHLMKSENMLLEQAFGEVKSRRPVIRPNRNFMKQLGEYENVLLASNQRKRFTVETTLQLSPIVGRRNLSDANTRSTPDLSMKSKEQGIVRETFTPPNTPGSRRKIMTDSENFPITNIEQKEPFTRFNARERQTTGVHRSQSMRERGSYSKVELQRWSGQEYEDYEHLAPGVIQRRLRALTEPERRTVEADLPESNHLIRQGFVQQQAQTIERSGSPEILKPNYNEDELEQKKPKKQDQEPKHEYRDFQGQNSIHQSFYKQEGQDKTRFQVHHNPQTSLPTEPRQMQSHVEFHIRAAKKSASSHVQNSNSAPIQPRIYTSPPPQVKSTLQATTQAVNRSFISASTIPVCRASIPAFIQPTNPNLALSTNPVMNGNQTRVVGRLANKSPAQQQQKIRVRHISSSSDSSVEEYADGGPHRQNKFKDYETDSDIDYTLPFQWMKQDQLAKLRRAIANNTRKNTETSI